MTRMFSALFAFLILIPFLHAADSGDESKPVPAAGTKTDLMRLINPQRDCVTGTWGFTENALQGKVKGQDRPWLQIPTKVPDEYDFKMVFEGTNKMEILQFFTHGGKGYTFTMNPKGAGSCALPRMNRNDGPRPVEAHLPAITPNVKHSSLIQVRNDSVKVFFDGALVMDVTTDYSGYDPAHGFNHKNVDDKAIGAGSNSGSILIYDLTLTAVK